MRNAQLNYSLDMLEGFIKKGNESFSQLNEALRNDDMDQAYVLLDELMSAYAKIATMRSDLLVGFYHEEKMKLQSRATMQQNVCGCAPAVYVREDIERRINKKSKEGAEK